MQITSNRLTIETLMDQGNQTFPVTIPGWQTLLTYGRMVKFSHSIFALPFALAAVILAQRTVPLQWLDLIWILIAMVSARSAAMGFNRIVDARFDGQNPRTQNREIPAGQISMTSAGIFVLVSALIFLLMAWLLGKTCFYLAFPVLGILLAYSYTKRFTWGSHLFLGLAIALAPMGAWVAVTKSFDGGILWLSLALLTHIAGFDVLYACQDYDFDKKRGLHSIPTFFGIERALGIAKITHVLSFIAFAAVAFVFELNWPYLISVIIIGCLLVVEHKLVSPDDLSRVHVAFFHINSIIALVLFAGIFLDEIWRRAA